MATSKTFLLSCPFRGCRGGKEEFIQPYLVEECGYPGIALATCHYEADHVWYFCTKCACRKQWKRRTSRRGMVHHCRANHEEGPPLSFQTGVDYKLVERSSAKKPKFEVGHLRQESQDFFAHQATAKHSGAAYLIAKAQMDGMEHSYDMMEEDDVETMMKMADLCSLLSRPQNERLAAFLGAVMEKTRKEEEKEPHIQDGARRKKKYFK